ncbi:MAG: serine/threonine protein kinase [Myxococcales bacterium]|nr:serine/threonine protein kinase [Myxococcales bacterium]
MSTPPTTAHENRDEEVVESGDGFPLGAMIGSRYRILGHIGRGGMGEIYRALHVVLRREVALKVIARRWAKRRVIRARFRAEVRRAASIIDDHVVQIYDAGALTDGRPYLVMELLLGDTLAARLEPRDALGLLETLEIALGIALGLRAAHRQGIVHRDVTPSNVMLVPDGDGWRPKLLDFGLAVDLGVRDDAPRLTAPGARVGTALYMAPEQIACARVSPRTDVYALGELTFEMLVGWPPFGGATAEAIYRRKREGRHPSFRTVRPELGAELAGLLDACLARDPEDRPDLERIIDQLVIARAWLRSSGRAAT